MIDELEYTIRVQQREDALWDWEVAQEGGVVSAGKAQTRTEGIEKASLSMRASIPYLKDYGVQDSITRISRYDVGTDGKPQLYEWFTKKGMSGMFRSDDKSDAAMLKMAGAHDLDVGESLDLDLSAQLLVSESRGFVRVEGVRDDDMRLLWRKDPE